MNEIEKKLQDKTILVLGASSKIGRRIVLNCAKNGAKVIAVARDENPLNKLYTELDEEWRSNYFPERFDLSQIEKINGFIDYLIPKYGHIDAFIHATGVCACHSFTDTAFSHFERIFKLSYGSLGEIGKSLFLLRDNQSQVVHGLYLGALSPFDPPNGANPYAICCGAAVFGMYQFRQEIDLQKVRINCIFPTPSKTTLSDAEECARLDRLSNAAIKLLTFDDNYPSGKVIEVDNNESLHVIIDESFGERQLFHPAKK